jgi:hypothetical protein
VWYKLLEILEKKVIKESGSMLAQKQQFCFDLEAKRERDDKYGNASK